MGRRGFDARALGSSVSHPGIDPRVWVVLATVTELGFDAEEGVFADVQLIPTGDHETCYFGTQYAGHGFGEHNPLEKGDTVVVVIPMGDSGYGPVVIARYNNASDPPPAEFADLTDPTEPTKDRVLRMKPGQKVRIITSELGTVSIVGEGPADIEITSLGGIVQIGALIPGTPALDFLLLATPALADLVLLKTALLAFANALGAGSGAPPNAALTVAQALAAAQVLTTALAAFPTSKPTTKVRAT